MKIEDITSFLKNQNQFDDCALLRIEWRDFGHSIDFVLNSKFDRTGNIRSDLSRDEIIILRFRQVQEVHISNDLNEYQLANPDEITWSVNLFSAIRLEEDKELLGKYQHLPETFHHIGIFWESKRRIDIVFAEMNVFYEMPKLGTR